MGRKRQMEHVYETRKGSPNKNLNMSDEESGISGVRLGSMPDLPLKVQRRIVKRNGKNHSSNYAKPLYFKQETHLSSLYQPNSSVPYIEQLFKSLKKIGEGSFGDVYEGRSRENERKYAIKVTNDNHSLLNYGEVRRLENIPKHHHCVEYYGAWEQCYRVYIQMELCAASLDKVIKFKGKLKEGEVWDILVDIASGLQHLHENSMIHLDVKPSNIMVTKEGVCKLGDFGLVYNLNEVDPLTSKIRRTGLSVSEGDGRYVALEVLREGVYTFAGDVCSFGLMMLEMAAKIHLPSRGQQWEDIRLGILAPSYFNLDFSDNFHGLIKRMIQHDYTKRPSIEAILTNKKAKAVLINHGIGIRNNFMIDWDLQMQLRESCYNTNVGSDSEHQMSPPRQFQNSVTNIPPWNRNPLQRGNSAINEAPSRFRIRKNIVRKLF